MRVFLFVIILVTIQNIASANTEIVRSSFNDTVKTTLEICLEEQMELIEENAESYTVVEIQQQIIDAPKYCEGV